MAASASKFDLDPGEAWHCCLLYALEDGDQTFPAPHECADDHQKTRHAETLSDWLQVGAQNPHQQ